MPTDVLLALERRRTAERDERHYIRMSVILIPVVCCILSILLSIESRAYEVAVIQTAIPTTDLGPSQ